MQTDASVSVAMNISEIVKNIARYNMQQTVINEDIFGPLQNNSVIIVIQVIFIIVIFHTDVTESD